MGFNFRSLPVLIIPGNSITSQFYGQKSSHVDSPSGFTRTFIFHKKIYATNVATWPAGRLDSISENHLHERDVTLSLFITYRVFS